MAFEFALLCTLVVGLWIALDSATRSETRRALGGVVAVGCSIALWAAGELLLSMAATPEERLLARRVLYLGPAILPVAWLWVGARSARIHRPAKTPGQLRALLLPALAFYSCLYWDTQGRYVHWTMEPPPELGPIFYVQAVYSWALVAIGAVYMLRAATLVGKASPARVAAIAVMATLPLGGNAFFVLFGTLGDDYTPVLLGVSGLLLRFAVLDAGLTAFVPIARRDVIEQLPQGVLVIDLDDRVIDANPASARLLGRDSLVGVSFAEIDALARGHPELQLEVERFPVIGAIGEVGSCAVVSDRTEARRMARQLAQAQRLEGVGLLTAGIAHEVNNPLAYIRSNFGYLEALIKDLSEPEVRAALAPAVVERAEEAAEILSETRDGVDRIAALVRDLKGFAAGGGAERERRSVEMGPVVEKACTLARVGIHADAIRIDLQDVPRVYGVEGELVQIVLNLVVNAIQASGREPRVEVSMRGVRSGVLVSVRDHGPGIAPEVLPRIFDPFFTTKAPGTGMGLGLSLSFDLARDHRGTLDAANCPDGGAVFHLWLPREAGTGEDPVHAEADDSGSPA